MKYTIIEHVRHTVDMDAERPGYFLTKCGKRFLPIGGPRDLAVHEPARRTCVACR